MTFRNIIKVFVTIIVVIIFCSFTSGSESERLNIPALGFSMINPSGWLNQPKQTFHDNLSKFEFEKDELFTLISDYKNSLPISTVTKYHPMDGDGVIPTINVIGRNNPVKDEEMLLQSIAMSVPMLKKVSYDFVLKAKPQYKMLGNAKSIYFCATYNLKLADGTIAACRNQTYAIPNGDFVIQISLIDKPTDNCDADFASFLSDLEITLFD